MFTEAREGLWLALRRPAHTWLLHRSRDLAFSVLAIARERVLGRGGSPGGNGGCGMQVYGNEVCMWQGVYAYVYTLASHAVSRKGNPYLAQVNLPFSNGKLTEAPPPR